MRRDGIVELRTPRRLPRRGGNLGQRARIAGGKTNWFIYLDTDDVAVIPASYDLQDIQAIIDQEREAVAGC